MRNNESLRSPFLGSLPAGSEDDPPSDAADVEHLITPDQEDRKIGRKLTFLEMPNPPSNRDASIDQDVEERQDHPSDPSQEQSQQDAVDAPMHPGRRVR